jgi:hypothetical protein
VLLRASAAHIPPLWQDGALRKAMGQAGKKRVIDNFSLESFARSLDHHIQQLVRPSTAREAVENGATQAAQAVNTEQPRRSARLRRKK